MLPGTVASDSDLVAELVGRRARPAEPEASVATAGAPRAGR